MRMDHSNDNGTTLQLFCCCCATSVGTIVGNKATAAAEIANYYCYCYHYLKVLLCSNDAVDVLKCRPVSGLCC
jgi:hypothetical protein